MDDVFENGLIGGGFSGHADAYDRIDKEAGQCPGILLAGNFTVILSSFNDLVKGAFQLLIVLTDDGADILVMGGGFDCGVDEEAALMLLVADYFQDSHFHQLTDRC